MYMREQAAICGGGFHRETFLNKKLSIQRLYTAGEKVYNVFCYYIPGRGITMADGFGPGGQDPRNDSGQNNTYHYNYSYGSGRGTTPPGGQKPPKNSNDLAEWAILAILLLALPFPVKLFPIFWLLSKLGKMSASDKRRYKQEARNAANRARNTAASFFQQTADAAQWGADAARQAADSARQSADNARQQAQGAASKGARPSTTANPPSRKSRPSPKRSPGSKRKSPRLTPGICGICRRSANGS